MEKVFKHTTAPTTDKVGDTKPETIIEDEGRLMPEWQDDLELGIKSIDDEHHKLIHKEFKADVARIADEFKEGQIDSQKQVKFNLFIKNWWLHHILVEDKKYVTFYKKNR